MIAGVTKEDVASVTVRGGREGRRYETAVITVPCTVAIKLTEAGGDVVGWTKCRVRLLEKRQPKCFRCQASGHLAAECKYPANTRADRLPGQQPTSEGQPESEQQLQQQETRPEHSVEQPQTEHQEEERQSTPLSPSPVGKDGAEVRAD